MKIGYARVSSFGQSLEVQLDKLKDCDKIFQEKKSARTDDRDELQNCLDFVRDGDTVIIHSLDRLARNLDDLRQLVQSLTARSIRIEFIRTPDTVLLASVCCFERVKIIIPHVGIEVNPESCLKE